MKRILTTVLVVLGLVCGSLAWAQTQETVLQEKPLQDPAPAPAETTAGATGEAPAGAAAEAPQAPQAKLAAPEIGLTPAQSVVSLGILGMAPMAGNEAKAKDAAVKDAIKRAVAQVALEMVDPATLRGNLAVFKDKILAKPGRFVAAYSPQAGVVDKAGAVVMVSVSVDKAALDKALAQAGLRIFAARLAVTLVLVAEETAPGRPPVYWWSGGAGMTQAPPPLDGVFKSLGVKLADEKALAGRIPMEARQPLLTEEQALELARMVGAGLVIMGRVRTYPLVSPEGSPPPLVQLLALDAARDGKVLAMVEEQGPIYQATPGPEAVSQVNRAVEQALRKLLEQVAASQQGVQAQASEITITLSGVRSLADLHRFEQVLGSMTTLVDDIKRESLGGGRAVLRVKLRVPAAQLADQLLLQDFGEFLVNVTEAGPSDLQLSVIPK